MKRKSLPVRGKAVEGYRSPRRWRNFRRLPNRAQRLGVRQSSGAWVGRPSNLELQDRLDAARANGRMRGVLADVRFPVPAALAFLAVGFGDCEMN